MKFNRKDALDCIIDAKGNTSKALVYYILKNGCNGFRCRKCPLGAVCDHNPLHSRSYAIIVLQKVDEREREVAKLNNVNNK